MFYKNVHSTLFGIGLIANILIIQIFSFEVYQNDEKYKTKCTKN